MRTHFSVGVLVLILLATVAAIGVARYLSPRTDHDHGVRQARHVPGYCAACGDNRWME